MITITDTIIIAIITIAILTMAIITMAIITMAIITVSPRPNAHTYAQNQWEVGS
jgi:hypothetical protein